MIGSAGPNRSGSSIAARKTRLLALLAADGGWVTAAELGRQLGVSSRSVRSYVAQLQESTTPVESGPLGYRWGGASAPVESNRPVVGAREDEPEARRTRILRHLVSQVVDIDVFDLSESLFVSDSTIESDLVWARKWLAKHGIRVERRRNLLTLMGDEARLRAVQAELIRSEATRWLDVADVLQRRFADKDFAGFANAMKDLLTRRGLTVNEYGFANAIVHIAVIVQQGGARATSAAPTADSDSDQRVGDDLSSALGALVRDHLGAELDTEDRAAIIDLLGVRALTGRRRLVDVPPSDRAIVDGICDATATRFEAEYGHVLHADFFFDRLRDHLQNLLVRAREQTFNTNPLTATMKASYPWVYELAVVLAEEFREATRVVIPDDEIAFLAFHLGASVKVHAQDDDPVTVCVYAPRYYDMAEEIAERLAVDRRLVVVDVTSDAPHAVASPADLLVTTAAFPDHPAVLVTPFLNRDDLARIASATDAVHDRRRARAVRIGLLGLFEAPLFVRVESLRGSQEAIRMLGALMVDSGVFDDAEVERILERESLSSTALVDGLAIPHAIGMRARRTAFAVAVAQDPVPWGDKWVTVVLMIAVAPGDAASLHVTMDALIAVLLRPEALATIRSQAVDHATLIAALTSLLGESPDA